MRHLSDVELLADGELVQRQQVVDEAAVSRGALVGGLPRFTDQLAVGAFAVQLIVDEIGVDTAVDVSDDLDRRQNWHGSVA